MLSDGGSGLADLGTDGEVGGARPLPLPRIRPPPSLRPDMAAAGRGLLGIEVGRRATVKVKGDEEQSNSKRRDDRARSSYVPRAALTCAGACKAAEWRRRNRAKPGFRK